MTAPSGPLATPREAKRISALGPPPGGGGVVGWPGAGTGAPWAVLAAEPGATPPLDAPPADPVAASPDLVPLAVAVPPAGAVPPPPPGRGPPPGWVGAPAPAG